MPLCTAPVHGWPSRYVLIPAVCILAFPSDNAICRPSRPCNPTSDMFDDKHTHAEEEQFLRRQYDALVDRLAMKIEKSESRDKTLLALHIGTHELDNGELAWYRSLAIETGGVVRAILLEPQESLIGRLRRRIVRALGTINGTTVINAALCLDEASLTLHCPSSRLHSDFPGYRIGKSDITKLCSPSKEFVTRMLSVNQIDGAGPVDPYVDSFLVPCLTPSGLLRETGLEPGDIDIFVMDTEGHDTQLLPSFLDMAGLRPSLLQFEHRNQRLSSIVTRWVVRELHARGYTIFRHSVDIVAILGD
mmetsp:Transcript_81844/g.254010  ORF Transcript_81844/g.254010 Transcript_81844/m.254010 type:complete len:304 (+) Transcript_81844:39-950(+)